MPSYLPNSSSLPMAKAQLGDGTLPRGGLVHGAGHLAADTACGSGRNSTPVKTRAATKNTNTLRFKKVKTKQRAPERTRQELSHSGGSQWGLEENASVNENPPMQIPCREGCGLFFGTILEADAHVRAIHAPPRIDQLSGPPRSLQPLANLNPIPVPSSMYSPFEPSSSNTCAV